MKRILLSFDRIPIRDLQDISSQLNDMGFIISGVSCHEGELVGPIKDLPVAYLHNYSSLVTVKYIDHAMFKEVLGHDIIPAMIASDRLSSAIGGTIASIDRLSIDFERACRLMELSTPDMLIFGKEPEVGLEICLWKLAVYYGIPTFFARQTGVKTCAGVSTQPFAPLADSNGNLSSTSVNVGQPTGTGLITSLIEDIRSQNRVYLSGLQSQRTSSVPGPIRHRLRRVGVIRRGRHFTQTLRDDEKRYASSASSLPSNFLYFPLHYQPELTTVPKGGIFASLLYAVRSLVQGLSGDLHLCVKEHPATFRSISKTTAAYRSQNFYRDIAALDRVVLVHHSVDSWELIQSASATVTVTGSAGFEAISLGRPAFHLGSAWYQNAPGSNRIGQDPLSFAENSAIGLDAHHLNRLQSWASAFDDGVYHVQNSVDSPGHIQARYGALLEALRRQ